MDSLIEPIFVGHGKRHSVELGQIPECFYPPTGKNHVRGEYRYLVATLSLMHADLHKMYYDDESYNKGHGHAYDFLGIGPEGAIVIVRPDQCK